MPLLEVTNLRTSFFTDGGEMRAVDGVTFELDAGETLGLVGESASGKSVTALSLMRLVPEPPGKIVDGKIMFDGQDILAVDNDHMRKIRGGEIAMIFQEPTPSLNPVLTIGLQISESLELHLKMDKSQARKRTIELLEMVGIPNAAKRLNDYAHQFSGGMCQRVMIAMALSCAPKLILADEITTALDVTIQAQILDLLKKIADESNTAFIVITHDLGIVAGLTQRVHIMYAGQIVEKATTAELFANPQMPYTWGLLRSIPRLDQERHERLIPIEGRAPNLLALPTGCRFEPRCPYRRDICREKQPDLGPVSSSERGHQARCWGTQNVPGGGWLQNVDWRRDTGDPRLLEEIRRRAATDLEATPEQQPSDASQMEDV